MQIHLGPRPISETSQFVDVVVKWDKLRAQYYTATFEVPKTLKIESASQATSEYMSPLKGQCQGGWPSADGCPSPSNQYILCAGSAHLTSD